MWPSLCPCTMINPILLTDSFRLCSNHPGSGCRWRGDVHGGSSNVGGGDQWSSSSCSSRGTRHQGARGPASHTPRSHVWNLWGGLPQRGALGNTRSSACRGKGRGGSLQRRRDEMDTPSRKSRWDKMDTPPRGTCWDKMDTSSRESCWDGTDTPSRKCGWYKMDTPSRKSSSGKRCWDKMDTPSRNSCGELNCMWENEVTKLDMGLN